MGLVLTAAAGGRVTFADSALVPTSAQAATFHAMTRTAPSLPAAIARPALGVSGLSYRCSRPRLVQHEGATPAAVPSGGYHIADIRKAQCGAALTVNGAGLDGTGQTIGIEAYLFPKTADLTAFWNANGTTSGSSGGLSKFFAKPAWQTGTGTPTGSFRGIPDLATVTFNGTAAASVTVNGATQITAVAPSGVTTGPVVVTGFNDATTSASNFSAGASDLTAASTHSGNLTQADTGDTYMLTVNVAYNAPASVTPAPARAGATSTSARQLTMELLPTALTRRATASRT